MKLMNMKDMITIKKKNIDEELKLVEGDSIEATDDIHSADVVEGKNIEE